MDADLDVGMVTAKAFQDSGQPNVSLTNVSVPLSLINPPFSVYRVKLGKQLVCNDGNPPCQQLPAPHTNTPDLPSTWPLHPRRTHGGVL